MKRKRKQPKKKKKKQKRRKKRKKKMSKNQLEKSTNGISSGHLTLLRWDYLLWEASKRINISQKKYGDWSFLTRVA
jgi:hypothetical protein